MGDGFDLENKKPNAGNDEALVHHILEYLRNEGRYQNSKNPQCAVSSASDYLIEMRKAEEHVAELGKLMMMKPGAATTVPNEKGELVEITVHDRIRQLEPAIDRQFEQAIALSRAVDQAAATELMSRVETMLSQRRQELSKLERTPDIFQSPKERMENSPPRPNAAEDPLEQLSYAGLQLLRWHLEQSISQPRELRIKYAAYLCEKGEFEKANEQLINIDPLDGDQFGPAAEIRRFIREQLRRQEIAGGDDPLAIAWRGQNRANFADMDGYFKLMNQAEQSAKNLDCERINKQIEDVKKQLAATDLPQGRMEELRRDLSCLEELSHARTIVELSKIKLAFRAGDFAEIKKIVRGAIATDPQYAADCSTDVLNALYLANTGGQGTSIWQFNQELIQFQKSLSPQSFDLDEAQKHLDAALSASDKLPFKEIKAMREAKIVERDRLVEEIRNESDPDKRTGLNHKLSDMNVAIEGLNLAEHGPSYCKLMRGVFELANKRNDAAMAIFDELYRKDPEFASQSRNQIEQLRKIALLPTDAQQAKARLRDFMVDVASSTVAMVAAALVVSGTAVTGPGAVAAGVLAGSATKTMVRSLFGEEIRWHDPLLGAVDGLAGSAGVLARTAAMTRLANSGRSVASAERALAALKVSPEALEGLSGVERLKHASQLSKQALGALDRAYPWYTRIGNRIPFLAHPEYLEAAGAYGRLARRIGGCSKIADLAACSTASLIKEAGRHVPALFTGQYGDYRDFADGYSTAVAWNVGLSMAIGQTGRLFTPVLEPNLWIASNAFQSWRHIIPTAVELAQIEKILKKVNTPKSPESVREDYFTLPGPKVNPRLGQDGGENHGR